MKRLLQTLLGTQQHPGMFFSDFFSAAVNLPAQFVGSVLSCDLQRTSTVAPKYC